MRSLPALISQLLATQVFSLPARVSILANPLAYIGWAVFQPDAVPLTACQKLHGIAIYERHVFQVQSNRTTAFFEAKNSLQLGHVFDLHSTSEAQDHELGPGRSFNPQGHLFRGAAVVDARWWPTLKC